MFSRREVQPAYAAGQPLEHFSIRLLLSVSLPGSAGQPSTHGRWLLGCPAEPGDDSIGSVNLIEKCFSLKRDHGAQSHADPDCRALGRHDGNSQLCGLLNFVAARSISVQISDEVIE